MMGEYNAYTGHPVMMIMVIIIMVGIEQTDNFFIAEDATSVMYWFAFIL
jgi:hypothetical protein